MLQLCFKASKETIDRAHAWTVSLSVSEREKERKNNKHEQQRVPLCYLRLIILMNPTPNLPHLNSSQPSIFLPLSLGIK